jgi:hypothetical protein
VRLRTKRSWGFENPQSWGFENPESWGFENPESCRFETQRAGDSNPKSWRFETQRAGDSKTQRASYLVCDSMRGKMSRRLSLDVKLAAPSVAPPIVRRFAASSIGFKGREMNLKEQSHERRFGF